MNSVIHRLKSISLRKILTFALIAIAFVISPAFSNSPLFQAQAVESNPFDTGAAINDAKLQRIQQKAEDLGDSPEHPIGDTGLKNLKNLGENIPETLDLNARQGVGDKSTRELDAIQKQVEVNH